MLLFIILVTAILSLLGWVVYYFSSLEREAVFARRIRSRANYSAQLYELLGDSAVAVLNRNDSVAINGSLERRTVAIFSLNGKLLFQFASANSIKPILGSKVLTMVASSGEADFRTGDLEGIAIRKGMGNKRFIVVVTAYDHDGLERLKTLTRILFVSLLLGILLTALVSYLFANQLLKPISQIIYEVNDISSHNLSHRIRAGRGRDELSQLANTFNELLERLQKSFDIQKRFISNASHELSTPLTSVSSQLEVTLQKERNVAEYQRVLRSISEDVMQMRQLTRSLLEIAKADSHGNIELSEVRIDEVLLKITAEVRKINSDYKVELFFGEFPDHETDCVVFGNVELLHSAIMNIVENGCKYSPDKFSRVNLSFANHRVYISVANKGHVIVAEEIQKIFQPFYRGGNAKDYKGFGLGLALAKGITRLHKGTLEVESDQETGTVFTMELPSYSTFQISG